jgi:uncharacterized membrane protein YfcA
LRQRLSPEHDLSDAHSLGSLFAEAWALLLQPATWFVAAVVFISGIVRGFSGFGGALIFIPLTASMLGPAKAVAVFFLFDLVSATPYGYTYIGKCRLREILPMLAGSALTVPLGVWILANSDPVVLRWVFAIVVGVMLAVLATGWRYKGEPKPPVSFGLGLTAGIASGSTGMAGPIVIGYWLSSTAEAAVIRANIMVYYALSATIVDIVLFYKGLFTWDVVVYALVAWPVYSLGLAVGARVFKSSSDANYRIAAYGLIALAAVLSLPLLDRFVR